MPVDPHDHDESSLQLPGLAWAPEGDPTVPARLFAAVKAQCEECLPGLTAEAAANGDTLAVVVLLAETLLGSPEGRRCVPTPALQEVFNRINRMGSPEKSAVVGMLRTFSDQRRHDVAAGCVQATQGYIEGVYESVDAMMLKRRQRPWWMI